MYKEIITTEDVNKSMEKRITEKMKQVAEKVLSSESNEDFTKNLLDLCTLNRMAESHNRPI
uniref:Uncharacterized protein n=1 Tax=viral metagenome TaxID=1070528 RepID=A0A6H1ZUG1_9ZZZZ